MACFFLAQRELSCLGKEPSAALYIASTRRSVADLDNLASKLLSSFASYGAMVIVVDLGTTLFARIHVTPVEQDWI